METLYLPAAENDFMLSYIGSAWWIWIVIGLVAYFCGCFNGSVIVSKYILHDDVRQHGSGNAGLTNFYRTFGGPLTLAVILTDVLKAVVAVLVGAIVIRHFVADEAAVITMAKYWAGLCCMLGHMFPCMFHFKGGKGILSGGTIAVMLDWRIALVVWGVFLILAVLTRYVSLGSICAGASFPIVSWVVYQNVTLTVMGLVIGVLVVFMHRGNIHRLLTGTENKFSLHKHK